MNIEKTDHPLVSIILPTYNGEEFIEKSIESVLKQTYKNYELIICDDASEDRTFEILEKYKELDLRISIFKFSENVGLAGNWNRGLEKSQGVYVKIHCQDDVLNPKFIEETVNVLENNNSVSLACSFEKTIGKYKKLRSFDEFPGLRELNGKWSQHQMIKKGNWVGAPTATLFRRSDLLKIGLFDNNLSCSLDWEMWLRFLGQGNLYVIPKVLYSTRIHSSQETSNCIRNLGFLKDRISILHKIQNQPELYGRETWKISEKTYRRSVNQLLQASANKKPLQLSEAIRFLNQYQSPVSSWIATADVLLQDFYKSLKSIGKKENS